MQSEDSRGQPPLEVTRGEKHCVDSSRFPDGRNKEKTSAGETGVRGGGWTDRSLRSRLGNRAPPAPASGAPKQRDYQRHPNRASAARMTGSRRASTSSPKATPRA